MNRKGKLIFLCGKMAAGKSTLSKELADRDGYGKLRHPISARSCRWASRSSSISPATPGISGPGSASCVKGPGAEHELHLIEASDEVCKRQLRERSKELPPGTRWTTDAEFDAITAYFEPPAADENFNVIHHERA